MTTATINVDGRVLTINLPVEWWTLDAAQLWTRYFRPAIEALGRAMNEAK